MNKTETAAALFGEGFSCSQAIFSTYCAQFGLDSEIALRIAGPFGGGMAGMGETCGAVTGAFMVIGLKCGTSKIDDTETKEKVYALVHEFAEMFTARNGSIICRELLGCDISTPEGKIIAREKGLFDTLCPGFVKDAAEIIEELLDIR